MKEATSSNTPFTEGMSDIEGAALVDGFGVAKDAPKNDLRVCIPPVGRPAACLLARLPRRSRATPWSLAAGALAGSTRRIGRKRASRSSVRPNKPVLPIATTWLDETPSGLLLRQTDQSLGGAQGGGQRPTKAQVAGHAQRRSGGGHRTTGSELGQRTARTAA